jgi:dipeptidyl aminopeptidase/acylaminoacyl peptidase
MTDQTDIREFLHRMADETGFAPVEPRPVVRKARRRLFLSVGGTLLTVGALVAGGMVAADRLMTDDRTQAPAGREQTGPAGSAEVLGRPPRGAPKVDYIIDLNTDVMTPLPESILRTAGETAEADWPSWLRTPRSCSGGSCGDARYAASPDGSLLAYVGTGDEGTPQIFIAGIDGAGVRQITHEPIGATWPAWSPDGTMIAYVRSGVEVSRGLFVLDIATGESRQVTRDDELIFDGLQFTPDRASLLYTGTRGLQRVPIPGGGSTLLIGDLVQAGNGSLSPDGSLVTFQASGPADLARWVANADGTGRRQLAPCYDSIPAGTWSPDGSRIVCNESVPPTYDTVLVVDVATGHATRVATGRGAIWLDDHTLLVER